MLHEILRAKKLVLASASPRRKDIFMMLGLNPLIVPSDFAELSDNLPPWVTVKNHALQKARSVAKHFDENTVIVAADTLVYVDKIVLGKPENKEEAEYYLSLLSGKTHTVYTGVCILYKNQVLTDYAKSRVKFKELTHNEIASYVATNEPFDKAGAYGIQGFGCQFVKSISGCYFNVMGFPVNVFYTMLKEII